MLVTNYSKIPFFIASERKTKSNLFTFLIRWYCPFLFVGFDEEATFTLSARGQYKLIHDNYDYNKMNFSTASGITTWRCGLNQSYPYLKCRAKAHTKQVGSIQKVKVIEKHTHAANYKNKINKRKMKKNKQLTKN